MKTLKLSKFLESNRNQKLQVRLEDGSLYLNNTQRKIGKLSYNPREGRDIYNYSFYVIGTREEIKEFYNILVESDACIEYNFGGSPFEWASYIKFENFTISSPSATNGDRQWYHTFYADDDQGNREVYVPIIERGEPQKEEEWYD